MIKYKPHSLSACGERIFSTVFTNEQRLQRIKEKASEFDERIHKNIKLKKFKVSHQFIFANFIIEATNEEEAVNQYWQTITDCIWLNMPDNFREVKPMVEELL